MEKKKDIIIILLVVIIAILCLVIGVVLGSKFVKNSENTNNTNTEEKNENKQDEITVEEATKLVSKYIRGFIGSSILDEGLTEDVMMESTLTGVAEQDIKKYSCSKFNTNANGYTIVDGVGDYYDCTDYANAYDYEKLNQIYKEYYGNDKDMPKRSFTSNRYQYVYVYVPEENIFVDLVGAFGPTSIRHYGIKKIENNPDSLNILVSYAYLYIEMGEDNGGYTSDFDESLKFTYDAVQKEGFSQDLVDKYGSKMKDVEFVFEKENDNYILKSVNKKI